MNNSIDTNFKDKCGVKISVNDVISYVGMLHVVESKGDGSFIARGQTHGGNTMISDLEHLVEGSVVVGNVLENKALKNFNASLAR